MAAAAKSLQSCPTLCDPIYGSPPGSPIPRILQARTLEWLSFPSPMRESEVTQSRPILSDPMDCSHPGSSIHGIFQARVLQWGATAFSEVYGRAYYIIYIIIYIIMEVKEYFLGHPMEDQGNCVKQGFREILKQVEFQDYSVQFSSVTQSYLTLCNPMDHSTPGLTVHHQLLESTQTHVHRVGDAIQPSHPLSSPSPPALNLPQHQGLFQ